MIQRPRSPGWVGVADIIADVLYSGEGWRRGTMANLQLPDVFGGTSSQVSSCLSPLSRYTL